MNLKYFHVFLGSTLLLFDKLNVLRFHYDCDFVAFKLVLIYYDTIVDDQTEKQIKYAVSHMTRNPYQNNKSPSDIILANRASDIQSMCNLVICNLHKTLLE
ncbi:hypothetical protein DBV15_08800 [Temnothorax longispinosus]|uniref:Uncharacterized protein n=1 Tax=Temnothorax longispinosus TaxID=300112 RepID=A0A4S2L6N8_9HYME|nr:hypothetical protein DBV15_08800 [Temnothorax longispinosus]